MEKFVVGRNSLHKVELICTIAIQLQVLCLVAAAVLQAELNKNI